jgi:hypothetical protein
MTEHPITPPPELVKLVADAIGTADDEGLTNMTWRYHACAAIRAVAEWLRQNDCDDLAHRLEQEVER